MPQTLSQQLFKQAEQVIPGDVSSPVRSFRAVTGTPPFIAGGQGARVQDGMTANTSTIRALGGRWR